MMAGRIWVEEEGRCKMSTVEWAGEGGADDQKERKKEGIWVLDVQHGKEKGEVLVGGGN